MDKRRPDNDGGDDDDDDTSEAGRPSIAYIQLIEYPPVRIVMTALYQRSSTSVSRSTSARASGRIHPKDLNLATPMVGGQMSFDDGRCDQLTRWGEG